ncbi:MAG: helix-turn-helix transcriptional regulator [Anaerolineales bacterium]|nr:helix-turn-helix transcriptional regulator [Anaerolineales bacterium]
MEMIESLTLELRRGAIVLAVLSQLHEEQYGYSLMKRLEERGFPVDQGTLYPLLRRLEENGLLDSEWNVEGSRPRRYYQLNQTGQDLFDALQGEWNALNEVMGSLLS